MNLKKIVIFIGICIAILLCGLSFAQVGSWWEEEGALPFAENTDSPLLTSYPGGLIVDWQRKVAISTGRAAVSGPMTLQNREKIKKLAEKQALNNLIENFGKVRFDGFSRLSDIVKDKFALKGSLTNLINKTYRIVHEKVHNDEGVLEVSIAFNLSGKAGLSGTLFPSYLSELPSPPPPPDEPVNGSPEAYSGLIIDASELGVEGGLSPTVYSEDGIKVYSLRRDIDKGALITDGYVDYVSIANHSKEDVSRAGENPLIISAKRKLKSPYNCDIVVSREDARTILEADSASNFLRKLKVVILL
jgi:hypothetical protein